MSNRERCSDAYDVAVIGAGLAGMAAAVFAGNRGLRTVQIGNAGALLYSSGLFDLMGVHPIEALRSWSDPWAAMAAVAHDIPDHPYAKLKAIALREAFLEIWRALDAVGLAYTRPGDCNIEVVTSLGTVKNTYCLPQTMATGAAAFAERTPTLLVDFEGLREYSARGIAATLAHLWRGLRTLRLAYPPAGVAGETYAAHIARSLELAENRARLVELIQPHLKEARAVGLPAVLGLCRTSVIAAEMSRGLGVPVFEIPTMPTSVPGLRLKDALERAVAARHVTRIVQSRVTGVTANAETFDLCLDAGRSSTPSVRARNLVLATGRFMGGGLVADRSTIREPLMNLPVAQPASRNAWHSADLLDPRGHAVNRAGLEVDEHFRPQDAAGNKVHPRLFAIGAILGHHDWKRMKCGAGVAIGTAAAAARAIARNVGPTREDSG